MARNVRVTCPEVRVYIKTFDTVDVEDKPGIIAVIATAQDRNINIKNIELFIAVT